MKKTVLLMLAALMLPLTLGALTLQPNQRIMGHYTTDDLAEVGWGKAMLNGENTIATDITADELAMFIGSKIVAFRVGLAESTPVTRVFVIPVDANGKVTDQITEWPCEVSQQGWNLIELQTPYLIDLPEGYSLRIGFDYEQQGRTATPLSVVQQGDAIYPSLHFRNNRWTNYGVNVSGNLSLQCIAENDNFPEYIVKFTNLMCLKGNVKVGSPIPFSFMLRNLGAGAVNAGDLTFDVAIDGNHITTITNTNDLTFKDTSSTGEVSTDGLSAGQHTLSVTMTTLKGEPVANPVTLTATFKVFEHGFTRQMRLVEQFTSTTCTYCPGGTANIYNLTQMRDDIAWVAIHNVQNPNNPDPFRTAQADSIMEYQGLTGWPEGSFDRSTGIESANTVLGGIYGISAAKMNEFLNYVEGLAPSWATVNVNSTFDPETRKAVITIDGETVPNYEDFMGSDSKLTVYITEDGLVYPQTSGGSDYVHNNVLRLALGTVKGVALNKTGDSYKNEFTVDIPNEWIADNLNVVAFISRPLGNALTDIYVTNANKRKLGEFDEATVVRGDADGDGEVTISDVTTLIDCLLAGQDAPSAGGDANMDGMLSIDDVTTLIDYLLTGNWID